MIDVSSYPFKEGMYPFQHQRDALQISWDKSHYAYLLEMGCGKSKIIIDNIGMLYLDGKIDGAVIFAPKGVYRNWVEHEIPKHMSDVVPYEMAYWSSIARKDERAKIIQLMESQSRELKILLVNIEAVRSDKVIDLLQDFFARYRSMAVVDESTTIKNPKAKQTQILINLCAKIPYKRIASGNPIPNGPLDIYSQSEFLKRGALGFQNYYHFRSEFAHIMNDSTASGKTFLKVVGYKDTEKLKTLMSKFSIIVKKKDCLDLPDKLYQIVDVGMNEEQIRVYGELQQQCRAVLNDGGTVSTTMVLTQLRRLHQIVCGFVRPDESVAPIGIEGADERMNALLNILDEASGKVIIWATHVFNIEQILQKLSEKYGKETVVSYYGATKTPDRLAAVNAFEDPNSPVRFFVANPQTGKFGITLVQAKTVIYYSNSYNLEEREQSEDRAHRIGQKNNVLYIDLRCRGTVDDKIIRILKKKKELTDEIIESNWRWLLGVDEPIGI